MDFKCGANLTLTQELSCALILDGTGHHSQGPSLSIVRLSLALLSNDHVLLKACFISLSLTFSELARRKLKLVFSSSL